MRFVTMVGARPQLLEYRPPCETYFKEGGVLRYGFNTILLFPPETPPGIS